MVRDIASSVEESIIYEDQNEDNRRNSAEKTCLLGLLAALQNAGLSYGWSTDAAITAWATHNLLPYQANLKEQDLYYALIQASSIVKEVI